MWPAGSMVRLSNESGSAPKLHCPVCDKTLGSLTSYVRHTKKHEPPGGFQCRHCDARFCRDDELRRHRDAAHTTIACRLCVGVQFAAAAQYREHIRSVHNGLDRELFRCDECGAEYKTAEPFRRHRDTQCGTVKPHVCDVCGIAFVTKYNLKQHREAHEGEPRFCCSYCGKHFQQKGRLVEHERCHTGEKPYKCDVCGKCFAHRESIVTHSSLHTGVRLVECRCCQARFSCYSNLIKHRRSRPQTCGLPQYDPPKDRRRVHRSRIPATLNPTSEIKVSSLNKVLQPSVHAKRNPPRPPPPAIECVDVPPKRVTRQNPPTTTADDAFETFIVTEVGTGEEDHVAYEPLEDESFGGLEEDEALSGGFEEETLSGGLVLSLIKVEPEQLSRVVEAPAEPVATFEEVKDDLLQVLLCEPAASGAHHAGDTLAEAEILVKSDGDLREPDVLAITEGSEADDIDCQELFAVKAEEAEPPARRRSGRMRRPTAGQPQLHVPKAVERSWQCPHCVKLYHLRKPFERHLREEHGRPEEELREVVSRAAEAAEQGGLFRCGICDKAYRREKRLRTHEALHGADGSLVHRCPCHCSVFFASKEEAAAHAHSQHRRQLYCELCRKFFTGADCLKTHQRSHHGSTQVPQGDLDEASPSSRPPTQRNYVCDKCGKRFYGRTSLDDHVRSECGRQPLYECRVCGKYLTTAGILKTHLLLHQDDTPFQCDQCGKRFKVKAQYKTHLKTRHTDNKPFKCQLCPKAYPYRESLLTHMSVHTGIKRFLCTGCGKRFTCISNLQAHRKVQAETCGQLPLNTKATQYMGVQKGNLLMGVKPVGGLEYAAAQPLARIRVKAEAELSGGGAV